MKKYNIPIFVPHEGCPFDCVFCNQKHITGLQDSVTPDDVGRIIEEHLSTFDEKNAYIEVAFFGGSFTGIPICVQCALLEVAYEYVKSGQIQGIRISTRPDYITEYILSHLKEYGVTTIELGVQSMDEQVLIESGRGHTPSDVEIAAELIKKLDFNLGLQMMTGLPSDTNEKAIQTAKEIIRLNPSFVRIYPTLVVKDTQLEHLYKTGKYKPQSVEEAVMLCKELVLLFRGANIPIIRMALMTTDEISPDGSVVAGPFHSAFRELVEAEIYYDKLVELVLLNRVSPMIVLVNPREISKVVGQKRNNVIRIEKEFQIKLQVQGDEQVEKGDIVKYNARGETGVFEKN